MSIDDIRKGILRAADLLFEPGHLVEVRLKSRDDRIVSRYYKDFETLATAVASADGAEKWAAMWWTLQQLKPGVDANKQKGETTTRADIGNYRWLPIDIDRADKHAKKLNATAGEKQQLLAVARKVRAWLAQQGIPNSILADSGNGAHILIKVEPLPATNSNYELLQEVLRAIKYQFSDGAGVAEIDTSLAEPEQVLKIYGTTTRKSESTLERPWNISALLDVPEEIRPVSKTILHDLAALAPAPEKSAFKLGIGLNPDFDPYDFFNYYAGAFGIEREFQKKGRTYFVTDICILAGHKHTGSKFTGFILGDSFGYHCFSDDCAGMGIGDVLRKLNESYGPYGGKIWASSGLQVAPIGTVQIEEVESVESDPNEGDEDTKSDPIPAQTGENNRTASHTAPGAKNMVNVTQDQLGMLLAVIFKDPKACLGDFIVWRNRLEWIVEESAWPKLRLPLLERLLEYERKHGRLPTRDEFKTTCGPELSAAVDRVGQLDSEITLDHAVSALLDRAEYLDERRTIRCAGELLEKQSISAERKFQRERWSRAVSVENTRVDGSIQDHAEEIFERMAAMGQGLQEESQLAFRTPFPSINEGVLLDQERCFAVVGPPNNFKTSVLLSQAYFLAKQGKATLIITGEHEVGRLEEKITLLHGFFHRDKFALPPYKRWADAKVSAADVNNLRTVMDDWKTMRGVPGPLVVKHISDFGNDLDGIVGWMESSHRKYGWKSLIIDPFMELLLNVDDQQKFSVSGGLCQKLLALKTGYRNGEGLIVATSLQMKKAVKGKISELHRYRATLRDYERVLEASQVERYSGAVQRFDMLWSVAAADDRGDRGVMVCSRARHGRGFEPFYFYVDPASHFCFEPAPEPKFEAEAVIEAIR